MKMTGLMTGLALVAGMAFGGAALADEVKAVTEPDAQGCIVRNGQGYKWGANIDKDSVDSPFYSADLKAGKVITGPIKKDRNLNRTTDIGVIGIYNKDMSCALK